jgi:nicotinamidase-related amidase
MNEVVNAARNKGVTIIHAPSSTMEFYKDYEQRKKMTQSPMAESSAKIADWCYLDENDEDKLPIDDSDGGCDDPASDCVHCEVWTRQIASIEIRPDDCISDSGKEINNYLEAHQIDNVILMGVHINMCVLGRSFGIRSQIRQGRNVILVKDLTDSMYNPEMPPKVSHDQGTNLVIDHVEKFWCATITSNQLMK